MKAAWVACLVLLLAISPHAQTPSGEAILAKVDANQAADTRVTVWEMTIRGRRGNVRQRSGSDTGS